jgi:hypothetical protein
MGRKDGVDVFLQIRLLKLYPNGVADFSHDLWCLTSTAKNEINICSQRFVKLNSDLPNKR